MRNIRRGVFGIILFLGIIFSTSVGAKSVEYVLNYGASQTQQFIKYNCESNVHTAIRAYEIKNAKSVSIDTTVSKQVDGKFVAKKTNNTIVNKTWYDYQSDFRNVEGGNLEAKWRNYTSGSSVYGRYFINNGLYTGN